MPEIKKKRGAGNEAGNESLWNENEKNLSKVEWRKTIEIALHIISASSHKQTKMMRHPEGISVNKKVAALKVI